MSDAANLPAAQDEAAQTIQDGEHEWTLVNRDENRLIYKCAHCGAMRRE